MPATPKHDREERQHQRRREDARDDEVLDRAHAHRRDGVDLLGDAHVAELARHRAPGARGDDDGGEHRRELARERERDDAADHALGGELAEADDGADRERHPGEEADERDDERASRRR